MVNKHKPGGNRKGFASFSTGGHNVHHRPGKDAEAEVKVPLTKSEDVEGVEKTDLDAFAASAAVETEVDTKAKLAELEAAAAAEAAAEEKEMQEAKAALEESLRVGLEQAKNGEFAEDPTLSVDSGDVDGGVNVDTPFQTDASVDETQKTSEEDMSPSDNPKGLAKASPDFEEVEEGKTHASVADEKAAIEDNATDVESKEDSED